jgi:hypothetical protein
VRGRPRKRRLSPQAIQGLIWAGAALVCVVIGVAAIALTGRARPVVTAPPTVLVSPEVAHPDSAADSTPPALPQGPVATPDATPAPAPARPQELTEDLFVELSAEMVRAAESFTDSEVGQKALAQACESILRDHGVKREDFEKMSKEIAADPERTADVRDRVYERVDALAQPKGIRMKSGQAPSVRHRRPSPEPVIPQH